MLSSPVAFYIACLGGLAAAALALLLRRQEMRHPHPDDIAARGGLSHMLIGVFAWAALLAIGVAAIFAAGVIIPVAIAVTLAIAARYHDFGAGLAPLYRIQMPLAILALIVALAIWLTVISLSQGAPNA